MNEPTDAEWDGYIAFLEEDALLVDFDTGAKEPGLRDALPALLRIELEVVAPDDRGLPCELEALQMDREQDQLAALLSHHEIGGGIVARTTCRGSRALFLALAEAGLADYPLRKWARKIERECRPTAVDGGWVFFDDHILPGTAEQDWMEARDAVLAALEAGADPEGTASLTFEGDHSVTVPLDPFAIAAALGQARIETEGPLNWSLG